MAPAQSPDAPNIVVFLADSLRPDHLGCYGASFQATPHIDELSREGMLFERCFSQASWTKPSIGSLFSGVLPRVHQGTRRHREVDELPTMEVQTLRGQFVTIAEKLHEAGYHTAYFLANPHTQLKYGFARGFDHYCYMYGRKRGAQADEAVRWLYNAAKEPFFLFVHEIDPHSPYNPPVPSFERQHDVAIDALLESLPARDQTILIDQHLVDRREGKRTLERGVVHELSPEGRQLVRRLYQAEVDHMDMQFGRLFGFAKRQGLLERTLFVFTSDHGEAFGEHRSFYHGNSLYDEELHVPLVIRPPDGMKPASVPWTVSLYDLYATLLNVAGVIPPDHVQSMPLLDRGGDLMVAEHRAVFSDWDLGALRPDNWSSSLIVGDRKVIAYEAPHMVQAFDRSVDPGEETNLAAGSPLDPAMAALQNRLAVAKSEADELAAFFGEPEWVEATDGMDDQLEALGYL